MFESMPLIWSGVVTGVSVVFAGILKWFAFHTTTFIPRKLGLYDRLKSSAPENSEVKAVLSIAAEEEIFRIVFSRGGPPDFRKALITLYQSGKFSLRDLQLAKTCLDVSDTNDGGHIVGKFGVLEKATLWVLSVALVFVLVFFGLLFSKFLGLGTQRGIFAALLTLVPLFITVITVGSEVVRLVVSHRVCKRLEELKCQRAMGTLTNLQLNRNSRSVIGTSIKPT